MDNKNIISSILLIALIVSGITNVFLYINTCEDPSTDYSTFRRHISRSTSTIEPLNSTDSISRDVVHQVCEGLFSYDLRDISLPRINLLAEDYFWKNQTVLQVKVREGIFFHDGYPFNASAVKWNLDRINYLINATGNLSSNLKLPLSASLFFLPDGKIPIINRTIAETEYNVTIYLNSPFSPFQSLLCHQASSMLSPKSTPATRLIQFDEDLIGTGPFIFDSCTQKGSSTEAVYFSRWDGYWRNLAHFEKLACIIPDEELGVEADWYTGIVPWAWCCGEEAPDTIKIKSFTNDTGLPGLTYQYLGFNNKLYNATWRKVMCLVLNYSYIMEVLRLGDGIRANSPISASFGPAYNSSAQVTNNITKARNIMKSMGFGIGFTTDAEWIAVAESSSPFLSIPYTYNTGNRFREDLLIAITYWYKQIGINVVDDGVTWLQYLSYLTDTPEYLGLFTFGLLPMQYDPFYIFNELFNPNSNGNIAQVDDPWLTNQFSLALNTINDSLRNTIYKDIQGYITETGFFYAPLFHPKIWFIHSANLYNVPYNAMERFEAYGIRRGLYPM